jgi:hypothetical protein
MAWILLEALVALFLAVFIVWFTMGGRRRAPRAGQAPPDDDSGKDTGKK